MKFRYGVAVASALALCAGLTAVPANASANLLSNGSFEDQQVGGNFATLSAGDPTITSWTIGGNGVDLIHDYWNAADGTQSVDMSALSTGTLSQTVNTTVGQQYELSFWMAGNTDGGNAVKSMDTLINGNFLANSTFDVTGHSKSNMGWTEYTYDFVSTGGPTTVTFQSKEENPFGPALDNVSLKAVPEASTVITFALLMVGGMIVLRKRTVRSN